MPVSDKIDITQSFGITPENLFLYFIDPRKLGSWFFPDNCTLVAAEIENRAGGRFYAKLFDAEGCEMVATGTVLIAEPPHRLRFSWRWRAQGYSGTETLVDIEIADAKDGSLLHITHSEIVQAEHMAHVAGWQSALKKLGPMAR